MNLSFWTLRDVGLVGNETQPLVCLGREGGEHGAGGVGRGDAQGLQLRANGRTAFLVHVSAFDVVLVDFGLRHREFPSIRGSRDLSRWWSACRACTKSLTKI